MNNKKGFTLIELLVVIAIIGTLSSVVIASVSSARSKAQEVAAIRTLNEFYKLTMELALENGTTFVTQANTNVSGIAIENINTPGYYLVSNPNLFPFFSDSRMKNLLNGVRTSSFLSNFVYGSENTKAYYFEGTSTSPSGVPGYLVVLVLKANGKLYCMDSETVLEGKVNVITQIGNISWGCKLAL
jgi:prepilin-type N-terminal cleavage/methylation domain-containing protein